MDVRLWGWFATRSPLSHIGEAISTVAYLAQEPILQPDGSLAEVFVYSGNAWRGHLRDLAAGYMLRKIGDPRLPLESFHLLFAGGRIGGEQTVNVERARAWRRAIPLVALWGGGVGNQILPGKLRVANAYPVCREALPALLHTDPAEAGCVSYRALTIEKSFSRKDDAKDDRLNGWLGEATEPPPLPEQAGMFGADEAVPSGQSGQKADKRPKAPPEQMRTTVELLIAGTRLETRIDVLGASEVELGCLVSALHEFARSPHIGGQANRGHGLVDLDYTLVDLDAGQERPFVSIAGGQLALAEAATAALAAYDRHLLDLYNGMLASDGGEIRRMLGAGTA